MSLAIKGQTRVKMTRKEYQDYMLGNKLKRTLQLAEQLRRREVAKKMRLKLEEANQV